MIILNIALPSFTIVITKINYKKNGTPTTDPNFIFIHLYNIKPAEIGIARSRTRLGGLIVMYRTRKFLV